MPRPCKHSSFTEGCRSCFWCRDLTEKGRAYRERWGEPAPLVTAPGFPQKFPEPPCSHLGPATGDTVKCPSCRGHVELKLFACAVHGTCTQGKKAPGVASCLGCPDRQPPPQTHPQKSRIINMGAGGLGDAILGLCAVSGFRREHADLPVTYRVPPGAIPFVSLFTGWDSLAGHSHDDTRKPNDPSNLTDIQANTGYGEELRTKAKRSRLQRYLDNIGAKRAELPVLREPDRIKALAGKYAGVVVLAPFSAYPNREWSIQAWLTLEKMLIDSGYRVVVADKNREKLKPFKGEHIVGALRNADFITSVVLNASATVSNDSGLAHLSGVLGRPTVVLCGQTTGKEIFGFYPRCVSLQGHLACSGCWWTGPMITQACNTSCAALQSIRPNDVLKEVDRFHLGDIAAGRTLLSPDKLAVIRDCVRRTNALPGDVAEFGVYQGGSAKVIGQYVTAGTTLRLFDTFAGMPEDDAFAVGHRRGEFGGCSAEDVLAFVDNPDAVAHPGFFPDSAPRDVTYRFVHIDADLYQSTRTALVYFWNRLCDGGVLVLDDFDWHRCPGVRQAVEESGLMPYLREGAKYQAILWKPKS